MRDPMQVLHDAAGKQCWITVRESANTRTLELDGCEEGAMRLDSEKPVFHYLWFHKCTRLLRRRPQNLLVLGAGAFTAPKCLALDQPSAHVDAVDIESELEPVARRFFRLDQPEFSNICFHGVPADEFLAKPPRRYDFIFDDLFDGFEHVPCAARTAEHFHKVKAALTDHGAYVKNVIWNPLTADTRAACDEAIVALGRTFPHHAVLALGEPWRGHNKLLIGLQQPPRFVWEQLAKRLRAARVPKVILENMRFENPSVRMGERGV